jgi:hypothetical protein
MIEAGYESEHLYILAGISKPYNQFELQLLTDKVLEELNLFNGNNELVIRNYVYYLVSKCVNQPEGYTNTLWELKDICINMDYKREYMDFYLLYYAKADLTTSEVQWYWDGANRENIDQIIKERFQRWLNDFEIEQRV